MSKKNILNGAFHHFSCTCPAAPHQSFESFYHRLSVNIVFLLDASSFTLRTSNTSHGDRLIIQELSAYLPDENGPSGKEKFVEPQRE